MSTQGLAPLRVVRAADLVRHDEAGPRRLVEPLWPHSAVGIVGGQPKSYKSWLALDLAVSVASATPCLGHYAVRTPGPALVYLAEDALQDVRARLECLCRSRGLDLADLDLHVIAESVLRLDHDADRSRLEDAVAALAPRLLVLDPLVRLHALDESSSQEVSALLGHLRALQREEDCSVLLVHHTAKRAHARAGQSLRGSSDLHAWTDVGLYLTWTGERLRLTPELRTARAEEPLEIALVGDDPATTHLVVRDAGDDGAPAPLPERALTLLEAASPDALRRGALREELRVNNARLGEALGELERLGLALRTDEGWRSARHRG